jgi:hypothetical protein
MSESSNNSLPLDLTGALLRLYLEWPENRVMSTNDEANEFYLWMREELGEEFSTLVNDLDEVKKFIADHHQVLARAQYIKARLKEVIQNARTDARVDIHTQVFFMIYDCQEDPTLQGVIQRGVLLDIAPGGMRLESKVHLPAGTVLSMTVAQVNWDVRLYHLTGEVRWLVEQDDRYLSGISLFNIGDFDGWQEFYDLTTLV